MKMEIVHVDPGYGKLMESNNELTYLENDEYNPYSGVAFTTAGSSGARAHFPNLDFTFEPTGQFYKKVWSVKLSIYSDGTGLLHVGFTRATNSTSPDVGVNLSSNSCSINRYVEDSAASVFNFISGFSAGLHNISITYSLSADGTGSGISYTRTSTIEVDNKVDYQTYTTTTAPTPPSYIVLSFGSGKHYYVSNVLVGQASYDGDGTDDIPSDDGIPANTPVYRLPLGAPEEIDFETGEDGEYIAKENGKKLLQTVDTTNLISKFGNLPITHVVSYGNPGYRVGTAVTEATGLSKVNESGAQHGTHELSFVKDMHIYDIWKLTQHKSFAALNGVKVGWLSGGAGD